MSQTTLMGTQAEEKPENIGDPAPKPVEKHRQPEQAALLDVKNDAVQQFFNEMEQQNEGYCCHHVKAMIEQQIDGSRKLYIDVEYTKEMPAKLLGGAWGQGGDFDLSAPEKWFNAVYDEKSQAMRMPYKDFRNRQSRKVDYHEEYYFYRLIKAKNYRVFIDKPILELLKGKFDPQAWLQKYHALAGKAAAAEYDSKVQKIMDFLQQGKYLSGHDGEITMIKATIAARLGFSSYGSFYCKPQIASQYAQMSIEELHQELGKRRLQLREINQNIHELEASIGMERFDRFEEFG